MLDQRRLDARTGGESHYSVSHYKPEEHSALWGGRPGVLGWRLVSAVGQLLSEFSEFALVCGGWRPCGSLVRGRLLLRLVQVFLGTVRPSDGRGYSWSLAPLEETPA